MIVKDSFSLLKGTPNVLHLGEKEIDKLCIENGQRKTFVVIELFKHRIDHFTKDRVYENIRHIEKRQKLLKVTAMDDYILPVSFNKPTKSIVINLKYFGVDDIYTTNPDPKDIYSSLVYGICLHDLITGKVNIKDNFASTISSFLLTLFIRLFGKEYGLVGSFSGNIIKLKFLLAAYVSSSFFGIHGLPMYKIASSISTFSYKDFSEELLNKYDFTKIDDFISSLSDFGVMPGLNKYYFVSKFLKSFGVSFIPALEDCSRFISTIVTSSIKGSSIVPTYISKYNEYEYNTILEVGKNIFKKT